MNQLKENGIKVEVQKVENEELKKITAAYRQMSSIDQCFLVSTSSMLLASQSNSETEQGKKTV